MIDDAGDNKAFQSKQYSTFLTQAIAEPEKCDRYHKIGSVVLK
ncbi:hypothetical protein [Aetokthonos hydrillicola]|nr:hypothetical protein [Aetokthonos hydrillicola]